MNNTDDFNDNKYISEPTQTLSQIQRGFDAMTITALIQKTDLDPTDPKIVRDFLQRERHNFEHLLCGRYPTVADVVGSAREWRDTTKREAVFATIEQYTHCLALPSEELVDDVAHDLAVLAPPEKNESACHYAARLLIEHSRWHKLAEARARSNTSANQLATE